MESEDLLKEFYKSEIAKRLLSVEQIEKIIKEVSLTAYEFTHPYPNKQIVRLSGDYAPNKLAKAIESEVRKSLEVE